MNDSTTAASEYPIIDLVPEEYQWMERLLAVDRVELYLALIGNDGFLSADAPAADVLKLRTLTTAEKEKEKLFAIVGTDKRCPELDALTSSLAVLINHLGDFFARSAVSSGFKILLDETNVYRLAYFALALRETAESVFVKLAPIKRVKDVDWYDPIAPNTKKDKDRPSWPDHLLYQITGHFDWPKFVPELEFQSIQEEMRAICRKGKFSKFTHFKHDHLKADHIEVIREAQAMADNLVELLRFVESSKRIVKAAFCNAQSDAINLMISEAGKGKAWLDAEIVLLDLTSIDETGMNMAALLCVQLEEKEIGVYLNADLHLGQPVSVTINSVHEIHSIDFRKIV